jgi:DNA-binding response OmpR family regulator
VTGAANQSVLVVEDESSIASFVALYLKNAGYTVKTAATGGEALKQVGADQPSLIVLDLNLPDIDGIEVCRRIRKAADVPIIMLTARDEDVDKIIGLEVGADDYLTKPFNPRELVARVKSVLRRSTPAAVRSTSATRRSSSRRRSSTSSGSCSTTAGSSSRATNCSSGYGATRSPATRGPSTCTCGSCGASSARRLRS